MALDSSGRVSHFFYLRCKTSYTLYSASTMMLHTHTHTHTHTCALTLLCVGVLGISMFFFSYFCVVTLAACGVLWL